MADARKLAAAMAAVQAFLADDESEQKESGTGQRGPVFIHTTLEGKSSLMTAVLTAVQAYIEEESQGLKEPMRRRRAWKSALPTRSTALGIGFEKSWKGRD